MKFTTTVTYEVHQSILEDGKYERSASFETIEEASDHMMDRQLKGEQYRNNKGMYKICQVVKTVIDV